MGDTVSDSEKFILLTFLREQRKTSRENRRGAADRRAVASPRRPSSLFRTPSSVHQVEQAERNSAVSTADANGIKDIVHSRGIDFPLHFTQVANFSSIQERGLLSRKSLSELGIKSEVNDEIRYDGELSGISCSIDHTNFKLLCAFNSRNKNRDWVVIALKRSVLWKKECAFCNSNAASRRVTSVPLEKRKGAAAFEGMFRPVPGKPSRASLKLQDSSPTDPQAEVLVLEDIEPEYIFCTFTPTDDYTAYMRAKYPDFDFMTAEYLFSDRIDGDFW